MHPKQISRRSILLAGIIAILAGLAGVTADLMLQFTPNPAHLFAENLIALDVSPQRLFAGHYLGLAAILLTAVGFWQVSRGLLPAGPRAAGLYFWINTADAAVGAAFHGTFIFVALAAQAQQGTTGAAYQAFANLLAQYSAAQAGLVAVALLAIIAGSLFFMLAVAFKRSAYPRWMAAGSPLVFILLLRVVAGIAPPLALFIVPAALNLGHLAFFALSTVVLSRSAAAEGG